MRLEQLAIGILIFGFCIVMGILFLTDMGDNYDVEYNKDVFGDLNETFYTDSYDDYKDYQGDSISDSTTEDESDIGILKKITRGIKRIYTSGKTTGKAIETVSKQTGIIPKPVNDLFIIIIGILVVVFIIYMLARFKPPNY